MKQQISLPMDADSMNAKSLYPASVNPNSVNPSPMKPDPMPGAAGLSTNQGLTSISHTAALLRSGALVLAGSALVAICAHIALPLYFTPVPLSLAPFAVLLIGLAMRPGLAAATLGAYLFEGALGLPVFAPTSALPGMAHLMGPTGGYLLSYPLAAALIALMVQRFGRSFVPAAMAAAAGNALILASGALWLAALTHTSIAAAFSLGVAPFLPGDALKVAAAAGLAAGYSRMRRAR